VDADAERAALVSAGLEAAGCTVVAIASDTAEPTRLARGSGAEVIVCDLDDPGRGALESMRALNRNGPRPVVLFAEKGEPEQIEAALEAGVAAYVVEGLVPGRARPVIEVAIRRFRAHHAMRTELDATRATLAALSGYLVGEVEQAALMTHSLAGPQAAGARYRPGKPIASLDLAARCAVTGRGERIAYDWCVLATGSKSFRLPLPGADLRGVIPWRRRGE